MVYAKINQRSAGLCMWVDYDRASHSHQTRCNDAVLCWPSVVDGGPKLIQRWCNVPCIMTWRGQSWHFVNPNNVQIDILQWLSTDTPTLYRVYCKWNVFICWRHCIECYYYVTFYTCLCYNQHVSYHSQFTYYGSNSGLMLHLCLWGCPKIEPTLQLG